jgi:hypothetical protein
MKKIYKAKVVGVCPVESGQTPNGRNIIPMQELAHLVITDSESYKDDVFEKCYPIGSIKRGEEVTLNANEVRKAKKGYTGD